METNKNVMLRIAWGGVIIASVAMMTGCFSPLEQGESDLVSDEGSKVFTFHVKGDFETNHEEMTRAAVRLEDDNTAGITDVWTLDYVDDVLVQVVHQRQGDEGFGSPKMVMVHGEHDVVLIASKGDGGVLTGEVGSTSASTTGGHRIEWTKAKDMFVLDYPVTVSASSSGNRAPELQRAVAAVKVVIMDKVPAEAKTISVTYDRSMKMGLPSLRVGAVSEGTVTLNVPKAWAGQTGKDLSVYTLIGSSEVVTDVRIVVRDASESVIADMKVENVTLKRNRQTVLKGSVFGSSEGFGIKMDVQWEEDAVVEF